MMMGEMIMMIMMMMIMYFKAAQEYCGIICVTASFNVSYHKKISLISRLKMRGPKTELCEIPRETRCHHLLKSGSSFSPKPQACKSVIRRSWFYPIKCLENPQSIVFVCGSISFHRFGKPMAKILCAFY